MGDMFRCPNTDVGVGDFGRFAADAKGEELDANASKPVRLRLDSRGGELGTSADRDEEPTVGAGLGLGLAHGDFLTENRLGPFTFEKGELVDAYAIKPLCNGHENATDIQG